MSLSDLPVDIAGNNIAGARARFVDPFALHRREKTNDPALAS